MKSSICSILIVLFLITACGENDPMKNNPFSEPSTLPYEAPDFDRIADDHFLPAYREGMRLEMVEIEQIAANPEPPTFENTIVAMERTGEMLTRVRRVFSNLTSAHTNDRLQQIQSELAPELAAHSDNIMLNGALFERVKTLYNNREELDLDPASQKLLEDTHRNFVRAGAELNADQQSRMREISSTRDRCRASKQTCSIDSTVRLSRWISMVRGSRPKRSMRPARYAAPRRAL